MESSARKAGDMDVGRGQRRVTAFDVAEVAGVSQSTVSRVLTGKKVTEQVRDRVESAAKELGYCVNERASRLRTGTTKTVALVLIRNGTDSPRATNPLYYELLGCICHAASRRGLDTFVSLQSLKEGLFGQYFQQGKADGTIVIGSPDNWEAWQYFRELQDAGDRLVFWGSPFHDANWVRSDNFAGGRLATEYLIERGYREIAFVGPTREAIPHCHERYLGYCEALKAYGLDPMVCEPDPALERAATGSDCIGNFLDSGRRFDAVFAASDLIASGVLEKLLTCGIRVPQEVAVVGYGGISGGETFHPPLTTIEADLDDAAERLVDALLAGAQIGTRQRSAVKLVERSSVGGNAASGARENQSAKAAS